MQAHPRNGRCIWCGTDTSRRGERLNWLVPFGLSAYGHRSLGLVCHACNHAFVRKQVPELLADPPFAVARARLGFRTHATLAALHSLLPGSLELTREIDFDRQVLRSSYQVGTIRGNLARTHTARSLAQLSRVLHKLAFERLAGMWLEFPDAPSSCDPYDGRFALVRRWVRQGYPPAPVRPVFRRAAATFDPAPEFHQWITDGEVRVYMRLFKEWYVVDLTSPSATVETALLRDIPREPGFWYHADRLYPLPR